MKSNNRHTRVLTIFTIMAIIFSISGTARAVDDGARAYWKGRDGTNVFSMQYLNLDMQASDTQQFDPAHFIYPNADTEADVLIASYARHMTLFNRASMFSANIVGGSVDVDVNSGAVPPQFLPAGTASTSSLTQSASGYGDPSIQLDVNLFGTPPLKSTVDLLNYEPSSTFDVAMMLAMPLGEYDSDKLVNMGLNRWYGRIAFPYTYHFGAFSRGYMSSLELTPSVWIFADNDDFLGQNLKNDSLLQFEAHLTRDFTRNFFGSLDLLYRNGFESEINGVGVGEELDIGDLGFTLNAQVTDNVAIRGSFSSNVFGDDDLDTSMIRLQLVYGWHPTSENQKKLMHGEN
jgi:hypothetical protein